MIVPTLPPSWSVLYYDVVDSTQRVAADLSHGAAHRTVVVARSQTAGYGRKGDPWHDDPGKSLLATLILRPAATEIVTAYPMAVALAVLRAIHDITGLRAVVKWPNDILINDRKVAGILGDATWTGPKLTALRIGLGLNIGGNRADFDASELANATSLEAESGCRLTVESFLASLLEACGPLDDTLSSGDARAIVAEWRSAVATVGRAVVATFTDGRVLAGQAVDVTDDGDLLVVCHGSGATVVIRAAEVRSLRHGERLIARRAP